MTTYYVSQTGPTGNDGNAGTSLPSAFLTVGKGLSVLSGSDRLRINNATYNEGISGQAIPSGSPGSPTIVEAINPFGVTLNGFCANDAQGIGGRVICITSRDWITVDGFICDGLGRPTVVQIGQGTSSVVEISTHITVQNCEIKNGDNSDNALLLLAAFSDYINVLNCSIHDMTGNSPSNFRPHCIYCSASHVIIDGCEMYNSARGYGVHNYQGLPIPARSNNCIFRNNRIHDCGSGGYGGGLLISSGDATQAYNNLIYNCSWGINCRYGAVGSAAYHNTVYNSANAGIYVDTTATDITLNNNIVYIFLEGIADHGVNTSQSNNLVGIDPQFIDASNGDFHLQPTSPAIDAGVTIAGILLDFEGNARPIGPEVDIGAYEFTNIPVLPSNDYAFQMQAVGGVQPYFWSLLSGSFPPGISMDGMGLISGATSVPGNYTFTIEVMDSDVPQSLATLTHTFHVV